MVLRKIPVPLIGTSGALLHVARSRPLIHGDLDLDPAAMTACLLAVMMTARHHPEPTTTADLRHVPAMRTMAGRQSNVKSHNPTAVNPPRDSTIHSLVVFLSRASLLSQ